MNAPVPHIEVDGRAYPAAADRNLLDFCLSHGIDLPYFCWHPSLGSVGACRQCAVTAYRDANDTVGRIVMACMTPAAPGTRISVDGPDARAFRARIIEWLMTNHPHDCPVCEEGGECHLQDMTQMSGHTVRRHQYDKRTFRNQDLGPLVGHEMNRCITCYRCVRFYGDYAGGQDLRAFAIRNKVFFGRAADGVLESEFSGNLVEVCPTGVFFDRPFSQRYARKWDLRSAPAVCVLCGTGCNTFANARYGELRRVLNRYHGAVNGWFLCDRGRYGHGFVNAASRLREPALRTAGSTEPVTPAQAVHHLRQIRDARPIGIGSPRATLEANFALREFVGPDRFYLGIARRDAGVLADVVRVLQGPLTVATIQAAEQADAVLVLGENVSETAPRLALALRQSVRQHAFAAAQALGIPRWQDASVRDATRQVRTPLFMLTVDATRLDDAAAAAIRAAPDDLVRLGAAIAHALGGPIPEVHDLSDADAALVASITAALQSARRPLVVTGCAAGDLRLVRLAEAIVSALGGQARQPAIALVVPECNSVGHAAMPAAGDLDAALDRLQQGDAVAAVVLENDLYRRDDARRVDAALDRAQHVVAIDALQTALTERAELTFPAATFAEGDGTIVNAEGRAQRTFRVIAPDDVAGIGSVNDAWRWLAAAMDAPWTGLDDVIAACAASLPAFARLPEAAPAADFRMLGMRIARETPRASGRTAMHADRSVHEPVPVHDADAPLSFTMEGFHGNEMPGAVVPYVRTPGWNSGQATHRFQTEVNGPLTGGSNGVLLWEDGSQAHDTVPRPVAAPPAFSPRPGAWLIVARDAVFGGEELSSRAPAIRERMKAARADREGNTPDERPGIALNSGDAARIGAGPGTPVELVLGDALHAMTVVIQPGLPTGIATVPRCMAGLLVAGLPRWGSIGLPGGR